MDWFDLLAVQGILKSSPTQQSKSISPSGLSFMAQHSYPYMTTGKTVALTRWTFVGKVMSLLFNTLSRSDIALHLRRKHLFISCLKLPSAVILEPKKIKSVTVSTFSPSICHEVMGPDALILAFQMSQLFASGGQSIGTSDSGSVLPMNIQD